jgi:hypothetical protein
VEKELGVHVVQTVYSDIVCVCKKSTDVCQKKGR